MLCTGKCGSSSSLIIPASPAKLSLPISWSEGAEVCHRREMIFLSMAGAQKCIAANLWLKQVSRVSGLRNVLNFDSAEQ